MSPSSYGGAAHGCLRSRVYETVGRPSLRLSVCLSVPSFGRRAFCRCGSGDIDRLLRGRRSAANASSVALSADVGS